MSTDSLEWLTSVLPPVFALYWPYWREKYASDAEQAMATIREYASQLRGMTRRQIEAGIERAKLGKWAPNPAEFSALCRARLEDIGAPSLEAVIAEIRHRHTKRGEDHNWSHPLCWHINQAVGRLLHELPAAEWVSRVTAEYQRWERAVAAGGHIPEPTRALPAPELPPPAEVLAAQLGIDISRPRYVPPSRRGSGA